MQTSAKENQSKLFKFFEEELQDIYWAENALIRGIPRMIKNATSPELKNALQAHLGETQAQAGRLEKIFAIIGKKAINRKCEAMAGLLEEATQIMHDCEEGAMRDAGIIAAAQKVEHYEIASYGTLKTFAETLGYAEAVPLLEETLQEEKHADESLTDIALASINETAAREVMEE